MEYRGSYAIILKNFSDSVSAQRGCRICLLLDLLYFSVSRLSNLRFELSFDKSTGTFTYFKNSASFHTLDFFSLVHDYQWFRKGYSKCILNELFRSSNLLGKTKLVRTLLKRDHLTVKLTLFAKIKIRSDQS